MLVRDSIMEGLPFMVTGTVLMRFPEDFPMTMSKWLCVVRSRNFGKADLRCSVVREW
jgi:hypothetical protein